MQNVKTHTVKATNYFVVTLFLTTMVLLFSFVRKNISFIY